MSFDNCWNKKAALTPSDHHAFMIVNVKRLTKEFISGAAEVGNREEHRNVWLCYVKYSKAFYDLAI